MVLAVPPAVAARLLPAGTGNLPGLPGPVEWRELAASPIVNVHVVYDRRVTRLPVGVDGRGGDFDAQFVAQRRADLCRRFALRRGSFPRAEKRSERPRPFHERR